MRAHDQDLKIANEAEQWVTRLNADYSLETRTGLVWWLRQSAAHIEAFLRAADRLVLECRDVRWPRGGEPEELDLELDDMI